MSSLSEDPEGAYDNLSVSDSDEHQFVSISHRYDVKQVRLQENYRHMTMAYNYQVKQHGGNPKANVSKEDKPRKTRKDQEGRKYICGSCRIGYLSYPALYTHIKTKHNGIAPEGTIRGENGRGKKRGRPKNRKIPLIYERQTESKQFPKNLCDIVPKNSVQLFDQFDFKLDGLSGVIEFNSKKFSELLRNIKREEKPEIMVMPIIKLMLVFLHNIADSIDSQSLESFEQMFEEWANYIDANHRRILEEYSESSPIYVRPYNDAQSYTSVENGDFVPVFASKWLRRIEDDQMGVIVVLDFCNWLYSKGLTPIRIGKSCSSLMAAYLEEQVPALTNMASQRHNSEFE